MTTHKIPDMLCMTGPVAIQAAAAGADGKPKPPTFEVVAYTGGAMTLGGWDMPVVVDLDGISFGKSLVANLDHDSSKRVGNVTSKAIADGQLVLGGVASAATDARREVIESAADTFVWQASIEATPDVVTEVAAGKQISVNGQEFTGPLYVAAKSTLKGFAFVSHGADDNTTVSIAATADQPKENTVDKKLTAWIEELGFDPENVSDTDMASIKASFEGKASPKLKRPTGANPFEERKIEAKRRGQIRDHADRQIELRNSSEEEIIAIEKMCDHAIDANMTFDQFRIEFYESTLPMGSTVRAPKHGKSELNGKLLEAAICQAARMPDIEDHYDERTLDAAHTQFKGRIGLRQLFLLAAEANGHHANHSTEVTGDTLKAAFTPGRSIQASGFSTLEIANVVSNTANKFIMRGWNMVEQTSLRLAKLQNVRDFKTITTVSLTDTAIYEKVG